MFYSVESTAMTTAGFFNNYEVLVLVIANIITLVPATMVCLLTLDNCMEIKNQSFTSCYQWDKDTQKLPVSSCTDLYIHPGVYNLKEPLMVENVKQFSVIGNNTTFICRKESKNFLIIRNSSLFHIMNVRFVNCGGNVTKHLRELNATLYFAGSLNATLYMHLVCSIKITNVTFQDCCGYAIAGLDIHGDTILQRINVYHTGDYHCNQMLAGGILLLHSNKSLTLLPTKLSIHYCHIHNIYIENSAPLNNYSPSALSFHLHQQESIINLSNVIIEWVKSKHMPLVYITTSSLYNTAIVFLFNSTFCDNNVSYVLMMSSTNVSTSLHMNDNVFHGNLINRKLISLSNIIPVFQGYTLFANNLANIVLGYNKYFVIKERAEIVFVANKPNQIQKLLHRFIIEQRQASNINCPFLFENFSAHITFCNNTGYFRQVYAQSFLNNCTINNYKKNYTTTSITTLYKSALRHCKLDSSTPAQIYSFGRENDLFPCNVSNEYLYYSLAPIFPGQTVEVNLYHLKSSNILVYADTETNWFLDIAPNCELSSPKCFIVHQQQCTALSYTVKSSRSSGGQCLIQLRTQNEHPMYILHVFVKQCPLGFLLDSNGKCSCDSSLQYLLRGIECNIHDQKFKTPPNYWISLQDNEIVYTAHCKFSYCLKVPGFIHLNHSDNQCLPTRSGMGCGICRKGLSTIFGSAKCKKCSNYGLFMIVFFAIAGIVLVLLLFALDLTVTSGEIYGFILFVNVIGVNSNKQILTQYTMVALSNLDLGIEVCFYNGMTAYHAAWLQFAFPIYILTLVYGLVVASRYSGSIERLTRKKVIPVIATLILLSYNKIMILIFKGLCSYTTFHYLQNRKTVTYWAMDTNILFFGVKHSLLFTCCALVFLLVIFPINVMLLFTKIFYRIWFFPKYLKPFLDAYQASLKDNCHYFIGLEFAFRTVLYLINQLQGVVHSGAFYIIMILLYTAAVCWFKPFKSSYKTFIYLLYVLYMGIIAVSFLHHSVVYVKPSHEFKVTFSLIVYLAFAQFFLTIAYHAWEHCLCHYIFFKMLKKYICDCNLNCFTKWKLSHKIPRSGNFLSASESYCEYQDEIQMY